MPMKWLDDYLWKMQGWFPLDEAINVNYYGYRGM